MMLLGRLSYSALVVFFGAALCGCSPSGQSQLDEEKEPHFLAGKARENAMDYKGAIEAFEKALEVNPRSASAHFELGLLYEKNEMDYAAAIFHFDRFLRQRPNSDYADIVRQRILACKQELAKTVSLGPVTQGMQHDFEQLAEENRRLRDEVEKWQAYYKNRGAMPTNQPAAPGAATRTAPAGGSTSFVQTAAAQQNSTASSRPMTSAPASAGGSAPARAHTVAAGESPYSIAKKYGIKLDALLSANPGLDPKRLKVGQTLNVPSP